MAQETESQIISLLKDLQRRMTYLEKKVDVLINQSSERSLRGQSYSKISPSHGKSKRYDGKSEEDHRFTKGKEPFGANKKKRSNRSRKSRKSVPFKFKSNR